jgi:ferredoxin-NADP reductase
VSDITTGAEGIKILHLEDPDGLALPAWSPGAHVDLIAGEFSRKYSLCGTPSDPRYTIAVLREEEGRGGVAFHP